MEDTISTEPVTKTEVKQVVKTEITKAQSSASRTAMLLCGVAGTTLGVYLGKKIHKGLVVEIIFAAIGAYVGVKAVQFANKNEVIQSIVY